MLSENDRSEQSEAVVTPIAPGHRTASGGVAPDNIGFATEPRSRRRSSATSTRTWLEGSRTARKWDTDLIGWAALSVGAGLILSILLPTLVSGPAGTLLASTALWTGMAAPLIAAFVRTRPRGLLRFRPSDLLYGVTLGLALRLVQGWLAVAAGGDGALPSHGQMSGTPLGLWSLTGLLGPILLAPLLEELLFRGVILVAVYRIARRGLDGASLALVASSAAFVALHMIVSPPVSWEAPATLTLFGLVAAALVLLTGRIWGAVLMHAFFNGTGLLLSLAGTAFVG
ncbi:CPBP family intramembrane glutamic endopeptidase [Microbacterium album]|uniref:CAAX prenyl protease 2/Lysostaphin resistance protein A-like domain-containing protein n=1 Tax=Microbacterium album TaxID=2053191 RepID=A0A917IER6_9MICO|nr:type II CAAX endopeptidase family protein [Microbacterium album]GGH41156.1 hypothetical protein GCM10010921_13530 [Microbacterium album]